jgi:hypothetical protein
VILHGFGRLPCNIFVLIFRYACRHVLADTEKVHLLLLFIDFITENPI